MYWVPEACWPDLDDWEEVPEVYQRSSVTLRDGRSVWLYEAAQGNLQQIPPQSFQHPPLTSPKNQRLAVE